MRPRPDPVKGTPMYEDFEDTSWGEYDPRDDFTTPADCECDHDETRCEACDTEGCQQCEDNEVNAYASQRTAYYRAV